MGTRRVYFLAHGRVQGVFYRKFTANRAQELNLTGWVRNRSDEKVEGEAQGDETSVAQLIKDLKKGPTHALVSKLDVEDRELVDGESGFQVRRG
ncbi:Acylphosphatase [Neurospora crassa]|uniref:acylphosphatase n=2 Tax=Neurospora TaxID=5140 RepID=V5IQJ6_NEUCR|nr:hypothetical protein NCU16374 [Neurospora crassa OR74A]EGZ77740.1 Acylphosphatase [Neurospora tetrasperma FGSC 2509]KAK3487305.1 Acylphosphatase [Neurospora crassa]KAK3488694.1 Acylphosphatase [Neurospora hispaniola]ESA43975.1 hypothetical protein NCU16374 [Neurospora crassa OR74A]KHE90207.1 Acylphosphatase [Neurospora crassa]|eukprot:XP_011393367.1 hypothetical protein NCU16374 [Neurospora crassa OR74A]